MGLSASSEEEEELHNRPAVAVVDNRAAADHSLLAVAEGGSLAVAGRNLLAADHNLLVAGRSLEERQQEEQTVPGHRRIRPAAEVHRSRERHQGVCLTFHPWYRKKGQLHRGST
jgi:hypothetical protein